MIPLLSITQRGRGSVYTLAQCTRAACFPLSPASLVHRPGLWRNGEHFKFMLNLPSDGLTLVFDPTLSPAGSLDRQGRGRGRGHTQMSFFTAPREGAFQPASHFSAGG